jgi:HAMP domain-containing protein
MVKWYWLVLAVLAAIAATVFFFKKAVEQGIDALLRIFLGRTK